MVRVVRDVGVFPVARALIVLGAVVPPLAEAHPAEVMAAGVALHVVAAAVLLDADLTGGAVLERGSIMHYNCNLFKERK